MQSLHEKIKALRKAKGLTQTELAEEVGLKYQSVQKWEDGRGRPTTAQLKAVSEILGVTVEELLEDQVIPVIDGQRRINAVTNENAVSVPPGHTIISTQSLLDSAQEKLEMQRKISELQAQVIAMKEKELQEKQQEIERQRAGRPNQDAPHTQP